MAKSKLLRNESLFKELNTKKVLSKDAQLA